MTPYQKHVARWRDCRRCALCHRRGKVVLARGRVPAPVLFVGEAPGDSEDVVGIPFCGPAGKLLDRIIDEAIDGQLDYAVTNLVGCVPKEDPNNGAKSGEPSEDAIQACAMRLREFALLVQPKLIVCVGKLSKLWAATSCGKLPGEPHFIDVIHPAAILRADVSQRGLAVQRSIVTIETAIEELE